MKQFVLNRATRALYQYLLLLIAMLSWPVSMLSYHQAKIHIVSDGVIIRAATD